MTTPSSARVIDPSSSLSNNMKTSLNSGGVDGRRKGEEARNIKVTVVIRQTGFEMLTIKLEEIAKILIEFCGKQSLKVVDWRQKLWNSSLALDQNQFALTKHFNFNVP